MDSPGVRARLTMRVAWLVLAALMLVAIAWFAWRASAPASSESSITTNAAAPAVEPATPARESGERPGDAGESASSPVDAESRRSTTVPAALPVVSQANAAATHATHAAAAVSAPAFDSPQDAGDDDEPNLFPRGWRRCFGWSGGARGDYEFAADSSTWSSGQWSVRVQSLVDRPDPAGASICQYLAASAYKGKRVRVTLHLRTQHAEPGAHMLFRADTASGLVAAFYNMSPQWVRGSSDWAEYSAVLDVPESASAIVFAGTLVNTGTLWMDDASIEVVDSQTKLTQPPTRTSHYNQVIAIDQLPTRLQNPGFEENSRVPAGS